MKKKIVIIGAGPAGLTAGYELLKENNGEYEVIILEEDYRVGGISKTVQHNGNRMDLGGHRFFSKDEKIMKFWNEIMPVQGEPAFDDKELHKIKSFQKDGPNPEIDDRVMLIRDRFSRIYYLKKFFDYPISIKISTFTSMGLIRTVKAGFSYLKSIFMKKNENSLEDFYINRFGKVLYSMFFEKYTEKVWGRHPSQISSDWGEQRVKSLSIRVLLKDALKKIFRHKGKFDYFKYNKNHFCKKNIYKNDLRKKNICKNNLCKNIVYKDKIENVDKLTYIEKNENVDNLTYIEKNNSVETSLIEQFWYPKLGPGQFWKILAEEIKNLGGKILTGYSVKNINIKDNNIVSVECGEKAEKIYADIFISSMPIKDLIIGMANNQKVDDEILKIAKGLPYRDFITVRVIIEKIKSRK